ncbi:hypothetical protein HK100_003798 [Physocladia obscura]|uniref:Uncharacterized protein n=1 Tax=Physocladia obscura TaxID=109957 RepID=A0AAD5XA91_9FUNG|nr:hypothetical protein HK100_003798 [Physocladia obscura]
MFILYKSVIVMEYNRVYAFGCVIAFFYRIGWTIDDLIKTGGLWDSENLTCSYVANSLAGFHYTIADIVCDVIASIGAVTMFLKPENRELSLYNLWYYLAKENVLRSVITMIINPFVMWANYNTTDYNYLAIAYCVQNYVYIRLMNMEVYWS